MLELVIAFVVGVVVGVVGYRVFASFATKVEADVDAAKSAVANTVDHL